ncbi:PKD domain-containing protein [Nocardioides speluncae]|uniref:PKD domain-containing protein n=1 Tax=Nocardioides speluncae TaxID=2670337 RepID=UPI000D685576|nr:PKD domain-containing protein [Nocardioides speluncae]
MKVSALGRCALTAAAVAMMSTGIAVVGTVSTTATADTQPDPGTPGTVTADALPTWQINGVVWDQVVVGNTAYVTGEFTKARPPGVPVGGAGEVNALNIFAFDVTTGNRIASFDHSLNAQGLAIAATPDGSRVIVGGDFTTVDGVAHNHLAAFDTATNALVASFDASVNSQVSGVDATNDTVYAGGNFFSANGQTRTRLASFSLANGNVTSFAPTADGRQVDDIVLTPDSTGLVVGGRFGTINGQPANGMGAVDATTGALRPWQINTTVRNAGDKSAIISLDADDTHVYGTGFAFGTGNFEGVFRADPDDGAISWVQNCHGDTYGSSVTGGAVYSVGHAHDCRWIDSFPEVTPRRWQRALAFSAEPTGLGIGPDNYGWNFNNVPSPDLLQWFPTVPAGSYTGQSQGGWTIAGNDEYVVMGGEFPSVNNVAQQGLVRFAIPSKAPKKRGPAPAPSAPAPTAVALPDGRIRVGWQAAYDMDNELLTYRITRSDSAQVLGTKTQRSAFWWYPSMSFVDDTATPGQSYTYTIKANDANGNIRNLGTTGSINAGSAAATSSYNDKVVNDGAIAFWRLGESSGSRVNDYAGSYDASVTSSVERNITGAIVGDPDRATRFTSGLFSNSNVASDAIMNPSREFAVEAWVKTTTSSGGKIVGYHSSRTGTGGSADRHLYMRSNGQINFGVELNGRWTISSPQSYNNGQWHHIVGLLDRDAGMKLYVDGQQVAENPSVKSARHYFGYWRVGGGNLSNWPNRPSRDFISADIDDVAVYGHALSASTVADHNTLGRGTVPNQAPIADFSWTRSATTVSFDGSGSSDPDGTIASYSWDFGDGSPAGSGATPDHTYAADGTYDVTLTVTDNLGRTASQTLEVSVLNESPVADFSATPSELSVSVDGTDSDDPDGSIASYAWNFGDGNTDTGPTASHTYAASGTYNVTLTVTDNQGATDSITKPVTVSSTPIGIVSDAFGRTVSGGWGTTDTGQSWTGTGSASSFAVQSGVGRITMSAPGSGPAMRVGGITQLDTDTRTSVGLDKMPTGTGVFVSVMARDQGSAGSYRAVVNLRANGSVSVALTRNLAGGTTTLQPAVVVPGLTYAVGDRLELRFQVVPSGGSSVLRAKVWKQGTGEPGSWVAEASDADPTLATAGGAGVMSFLAGSATNAPLMATFDDFTVTTAP